MALSALIHTECVDDLVPIDRLIREFYRVICFPEGGAPDFESFTGLFTQHARITRVTPEGVDHLDVKGFGALVRELLELGAFTSTSSEEPRTGMAACFTSQALMKPRSPPTRSTTWSAASTHCRSYSSPTGGGS